MAYLHNVTIPGSSSGFRAAIDGAQDFRSRHSGTDILRQSVARIKKNNIEILEI
jgi:hypothetical protein